MAKTAKDLLCFAHKGEAQHFLSHSKSKLLENSKFQVWELSEFYVLVSGEGPEAAQFALSLFLAKNSDQVSRVINIGIAGSLSPKLENESIYRSSVVLKESSLGSPAFQAFETIDISEKQYCITALERVKDDDYAKKLSTHGELVDREAWGFAYTGSQFKKDFQCIKLISDKAGAETLCFDIKEKASEYSFKLFEYYKENFMDLSDQRTIESSEIQWEPDFHFSSTQKKQLEKSLLMLKAKSPKNYDLILSESNLSDIKSELSRPKDRSRVLLEEIQNALNPFHNQIYDRLNTWFSNKPNAIKQVQTDPQWEKEFIKLSLEVNSKEDIEKSIEYLKSLPIDEFKKIFEGEY